MTREEMIREARKYVQRGKEVPRVQPDQALAATYALAAIDLVLDAMEREKGEGVESSSKPAPPCSSCDQDRHEDCGGPESGCGCAARNHWIAAPPSKPAPPIMIDAAQVSKMRQALSKIAAMTWDPDAADAAARFMQRWARHGLEGPLP